MIMLRCRKTHVTIPGGNFFRQPPNESVHDELTLTTRYIASIQTFPCGICGEEAKGVRQSEAHSVVLLSLSPHTLLTRKLSKEKQ